MSETAQLIRLLVWTFTEGHVRNLRLEGLEGSAQGFNPVETLGFYEADFVKARGELFSFYFCFILADI
jgi:hypothetical protein